MSVGNSVGNSVGLYVGNEVGSSVGFKLGGLEGVIEGSKVGLLLGLTVGAEVGHTGKAQLHVHKQLEPLKACRGKMGVFNWTAYASKPFKKMEKIVKRKYLKPLVFIVTVLREK